MQNKKNLIKKEILRIFDKYYYICWKTNQKYIIKRFFHFYAK